MLRLLAVFLLLMVAFPAVAAPPGGPGVESPDGSDGQGAAKDTGPDNLTLKDIGALTLDDLFAKLPAHSGSRIGRAIEAEIQQRFHKSGSDTADLLLSWGVRAFEEKNYRLALDILDQAIMVKPDFAEAWNKRATVNYMLDDYSGSLSDIRQALLLEPRHFGALSGLGIILDASNNKADALKVLRRALEINPQMDQVKKTVERLEKETSGQSI